MKNINSKLWGFVCGNMFTSKSAGKIIRENVSESVKIKVSNVAINLKYDVIRNMRQEL